MMGTSQIIVFQAKKIRHIFLKIGRGSIEDIIEVLTDSPVTRKYWNKVKTRE